ncbi:site-specific integrase [Pseudomonas sp. GD03696]|uniref:site-specific integrase n=1 Tax=Pseudomonas sp. GD03696 TaxID=2975368 RepID=UPI00244CC36C|nr:site-specific integrase [Pseudomonas sp. GD03696]MDH1930473.1 site-specific integrase [Pseudomonas sp. GD03696]
MKVREFKDFQGRPSALIFDEAVPVFLANFWLINYKPGLSPKSRVVIAYDLSVVMLYLKSQNIDIATRFSNGEYLTVGELVRLRNRLEEQKKTVEMRAKGMGVLAPKMTCSSAFIRRCRTAREFLEVIAEEFCPTTDGKMALSSFKGRLEKQLPCKQKNDNPPMVEPLSERELSQIDAAIKAQASLCSRSKFLIHRDLIVFHILRELGVRNSELLGIKVDSFSRVASGYIVVHIQRNKDLIGDPRTSPATVKTLERKLRVSDNLWTLIERYMVERKKLAGARGHSFLIVTRDGAPLSNDSVGALFKALQSHLGRGLTPHTLRHSWACNFVLAAFKRAVTLPPREKEREITSALSVLRAHMGWGLNSSMPEHYARYAFQKIGNDRLLSEESMLHASIITGGEHETD